jgi:hypothetical protein
LIPANECNKGAALEEEPGFLAVALVAWDAGRTGVPERMKVRKVT